MIRVAPSITPRGVLRLTLADDGVAVDPALGTRLVQAFARGPGHGLLRLGADEVGIALPPVLAYWRRLGARYVEAFCARAPEDEARGRDAVPAPGLDELEPLASSAPPMPGAEYVTPEVLAALWSEIDAAFNTEWAASGLSAQAFIATRNPAWTLVGRVHFHLAENRDDPEAPFAFLATYTTGLSAQAKARHLPLGRALTEYSGPARRERLLSLLVPVLKAADHCPVDSGEIYHPLRWTPARAMLFLQDIPHLERSGVVTRMPATWRMNRPPRPKVTATAGAAAPSKFGLEAILDFQMEVTLEGETLSETEVRALLAQTDGLVLIRGKWVEVDKERLAKTLDQFEAIQRRATTDGLSFGEAMRLLSGMGSGGQGPDARPDTVWSETRPGPWLAETLASLRHPEALTRVDPGPALRARLRPYQSVGVRWLHTLATLRLGACLADDMGLGKTIQLLALLLVLKAEPDADRRPSLLVAPASLLANWMAESARFAPGLRLILAHPSAMAETDLETAPDLEGVDLVVTSYGFATRRAWLRDASWRLVVLDEAQAIKNPGAKQTKTMKQLKAGSRVALTGTPIENRLGDLWSLFDFLNPGLLGSAKQFTEATKQLAARSDNSYGPLRDLVRPYILRRLKTDKTVIADLPDKTEIKAYCSLSRKQAALYVEAVSEVAEKLEDSEGIERKGIVLALLMRLKQICNHPSQWLGDGGWAEAESGKLARLRELGEVIAAKQEKVLVFTQFKETTGPLQAFLAGIFGGPGLVLHGGTPVKARQELVRRFQDDPAVSFFVLSVKAGGTGLNLTAASHVIHFDRWWNPAVENQATDRAFRIGQRRNVLVQKFICQGTVEDKIDQLIESKSQLAGDFLAQGAEALLTEMTTRDLLKLVSLDLGAAMQGRDTTV
jgi:non-specific serine/threonine protein kinase